MSFLFKFSLLVIFISQLGLAQEDNERFFQQVDRRVKLISTTKSNELGQADITLEAGSYLRPITPPAGTPSWAIAVLIVDSSNRVVEKSPYLISRTYFNKVTSERINKTINLQSAREERQYTLDLTQENAALDDIRVSVIEDTGKWYYTVNLTNSEGQTLDHEGNIVSDHERDQYSYRVSKEFLDKAIMENKVENAENSMREIIAAGEPLTYQCTDTPVAQEVPIKTDPSFPGCEVLEATSIALVDESKLTKCLASAKKFILAKSLKNNSLNRSEAFKAMYQLPAHIRDFIAKIFTAQGEAGILTPPLEEMMMIMKVLDNRVDHIESRKKGIDVEPLDMALQKWQFSMYNANDPGWKNVLIGKYNTKNESKAIRAFIMHKNTTYPKSVDNVYHYLANYIYNLCDTENSEKCIKQRKSKWFYTDQHNKLSNLKINNTAIKSSGKTYHMFYKNVPWGYVKNEFKP